MHKSQQKSSAFLICWSVYEASLANSVDPDQTAPLFWVHAVCFYKKTSVMLGNYLQQTTSAGNIFKCIFLGALRVNDCCPFSHRSQRLWFKWPPLLRVHPRVEIDIHSPLCIFQECLDNRYLQNESRKDHSMKDDLPRPTYSIQENATENWTSSQRKQIFLNANNIHVGADQAPKS